MRKPVRYVTPTAISSSISSRVPENPSAWSSPGCATIRDNESHLAVRVEGDYDAIREYHRQMGCICYENKEMNLYFIHDPDDYWIEILPVRKTS